VELVDNKRLAPPWFDWLIFRREENFSKIQKTSIRRFHGLAVLALATPLVGGAETCKA
jgi:hypothetical protein